MHPKSFRDVFGIIQRALGRIFRRQHHTAHIFRAQRIHSDSRNNGRIDTARQAQQNLFETGLGHVVTQRFDANAVILLFARWQQRPLALLTFPTVWAADQINMRGHLVKYRQLHGQMPARIQYKRPTVKDLIILTAHHVQIDQRQACLDHPRHHVAHTAIKFVAVIRRTIGDQQKLCAAFFQCFGNIFVPSILANRRADTCIPNRIGATQRPAIKHAHFVKDVIVWQMVLQLFAGNLAAFEDEISVIQLITLCIWATNRQRRAIGAFHGQSFDLF